MQFFNRPKNVASLALSDILHEWRMSICLILAIAAIATPLLLFFGLKTGTVETLRNRLLDNPVNMELIPITEKQLDKKWFENWSSHPLVSYVVPHTRKLSAQGELHKLNSRNSKLVDLRPTSQGDPLLKHYNIDDIEKKEIVLTYATAEFLKANIGDEVNCKITRNKGTEKVFQKFTVAGILPLRASTIASAYIHIEQLEAIESYKDGRAVIEYGWPGSDPVAPITFKDAIVLFDSKIDATTEALIIHNTGFAKFERISIDKCKILAPHILPYLSNKEFIYHLDTKGSLASDINLSIVSDKLRRYSPLIIPLPVNLLLQFKINEEFIELPIVPFSGLNRQLINFDYDSMNLPYYAHINPKNIVMNAFISDKILHNINIIDVKAVCKTDNGDVINTVDFDLKFIPIDDLEAGKIFLPISLIGVLNTMTSRNIVYQSSNNERKFILKRRGYTGFRMYANSLENVKPLSEILQNEGITINTKADRIEEVLRLDKILSMIFWVIAISTLSGGAACLISSIYAGIERKRRELAVLRLLGVHGVTLSVFSINSVLILTTSGMILALTFFQSLSFLVNTMFSTHLERGESFCYLSIEHQLISIVIALMIAFIAGIFSMKRIMSIEPSESLRDE